VTAKCPFGIASPVCTATWEEFSNRPEIEFFKKPAIARQSRVFCLTNHRRKWRHKKKDDPMKNRYERLRPRFAPEVYFDVDPVPFRARETTELENLKGRLLGQLLAEIVNPAQNIALRRAAHDAAALAWATRYPLLVFPVLLEEKARTALRQWRRQAAIRQRSLNLLQAA
jgi:hypothetical protein